MKALALLLLLIAPLAAAQIYSWTDEAGVEHFTSAPPKDAGAKKRMKTFAPAKHPSRQPVVGAPRVKAAPRVEMYATAWCPACRAARDYFNRKGVTFEEYDVEKDPQAGARFTALGGNGVPLVLIDGTPVRGFSPKTFDALLAGR